MRANLRTVLTIISVAAAFLISNNTSRPYLKRRLADAYRRASDLESFKVGLEEFTPGVILSKDSVQNIDLTEAQMLAQSPNVELLEVRESLLRSFCDKFGESARTQRVFYELFTKSLNQVIDHNTELPLSPKEIVNQFENILGDNSPSSYNLPDDEQIPDFTKAKDLARSGKYDMNDDIRESLRRSFFTKFDRNSDTNAIFSQLMIGAVEEVERKSTKLPLSQVEIVDQFEKKLGEMILGDTTKRFLCEKSPDSSPGMHSP